MNRNSFKKHINHIYKEQNEFMINYKKRLIIDNKDNLTCLSVFDIEHKGLISKIFIFIFLLIVSYIELVPKKILLSVLEKESKYPYNTVVRMQNRPFFFTTSKQRYSTAMKLLENCFLGGDYDVVHASAPNIP